MATTSTLESMPIRPGSLPSNSLVTALLTDLYQITMTYAHWKLGKHNDPAVFELFFRKNPFRGQFTIFCGLDECLKHLESFSFSQHDIDYLKSTPALSHCEDGFFKYLLELTAKSPEFEVQALKEGTIVFPRIPLLILKAPLGLGQLLETTLLNLVNYPSLIATNAARMVLRAKPVPCIEFGLRRAQGPDGACSASKYSYIGGFVGTSNVQAGHIFGIPISGTHAHSYVQSFVSLSEVEGVPLWNKITNKQEPLLPKVLEYRENSSSPSTNDGELAAFVAYACAFPDNCLCLIDTYDTIQSGLQNFVFVALALCDFGYHAKGVRLDSGNLAALSLQCASEFNRIASEGEGIRSDTFKNLTIVASNDINEKVLVELSSHANGKGHAISSFGIGTNLVTCQAQPALGCVYKLVEWKGQPRIKLSQDLPKVTLPGRKAAYRLLGQDNQPLADYLALAGESPPRAGERITCRQPFLRHSRRVAITASSVIPLHHVVFNETGSMNDELAQLNDLSRTRSYVCSQLETLPSKVTRYENPDVYPVVVSDKMFQFLHEIWEREAPMEEWS